MLWPTPSLDSQFKTNVFLFDSMIFSNQFFTLDETHQLQSTGLSDLTGHHKLASPTSSCLNCHTQHLNSAYINTFILHTLPLHCNEC